MFRCMSCGDQLEVIDKLTTKEVYGESKASGIVNICTCNKCGLDYEISTFEDSDKIEVKFYEVEK